MRISERMKKITSVLLCLMMLVQYIPAPAFAAESDGLCEHHTEHHTELCGWVAEVPGAPCGHEHTESCYQLLKCLHEHSESCEDPCAHVCTVESGCIIMEKDCHHTHDGDCGYVPAVAHQDCTTCQPVLIHVEGCGFAETGSCACEAVVTHGGEGCTYVEGREGSPCKHVCEVVVDSEDSCYKLLCSHAEEGQHDGSCGYVEGSEGSPCTYHCDICLGHDQGEEPAQTETTAPEAPVMMFAASPRAATLNTLNFGQTKIIENGVLGNTTSGDGWNYDSTTNTIYITENVEVTSTYGNAYDCIYADGPLNINVAEGKTLKATSSCAEYGAIGSTGDLSLTGGGTVEAIGTHNEGGTGIVAVWSNGNIAISGVNLTADCNTGIAAIYTENGSLKINGAVVTANSDCRGDTVEILGSSVVTVEAGDNASYGLRAGEGVYTFSDSAHVKVTAPKYVVGNASGDLTLTDDHTTDYYWRTAENGEFTEGTTSCEGNYWNATYFEYIGKKHLEWTNNGDTHSAACGCGKTVIANEDHTVGTAATCTTQAVCKACGEQYGGTNPDNHTWVDGKCSACDTTCTHIYSDNTPAWAEGACGICGMGCDHEGNTTADDGNCTTAITCSVCGGEIPAEEDHAWSEGECTNTDCTASCTSEGHDWKNGTCTHGCGETHSHEDWRNGVCTVCGYECPHENSEDGCCTTCGANTCEHTYDTDGFCEVCEEGYQPATDSNSDGVYEISNAGQLYWFAEKVNYDNENYGADRRHRGEHGRAGQWCAQSR